MTKFLAALVCSFFFFCAPAHASFFGNHYALKAGTYDLKGSNSANGTTNYRGEISIVPQGTNYGLVWKIGGKQVQIGTGILSDQVLSVVYYDTSSHNFGIVSYQLVGEGKLEGKWSPINGVTFGHESLSWKHN